MTGKGGNLREAGPAIDEVFAERVPQGVGGDALEVGEADVFDNDLLDAARREWSSLSVENMKVAARKVRVPEGLQSFSGIQVEGDFPLFLPLAAFHGERALAFGDVDVFPLKVAELLDSQTGVEKELDDCHIPKVSRIFDGANKGSPFPQIDPARPLPLLTQEPGHGRWTPVRDETQIVGPVKVALYACEFPLEHSGPKSPLFEEKSLVLAKIGRGDHGRIELVSAAIPEPVRESLEVEEVV